MAKVKAKYNIPGPVPMQDTDWRAESDYRSLCCAAEVAQDKKRLAAAIKYGEQHMEDTQTFFERVTKTTGKN